MAIAKCAMPSPLGVKAEKPTDEPLKWHYDDKQVANITYAIALMHAWNRVAIGLQVAPRPAK